MHDRVLRVILAYKRRLVRKLKRRSPAQRIKQRQYYRTHRASIRLQRRRYLKKNSLFLKSRKLFKRTKPAWLGKKKVKTPKPKIHKPKKPSVKKFQAPKKAKPPKARKPKIKKPKIQKPKIPKPKIKH